MKNCNDVMQGDSARTTLQQKTIIIKVLKWASNKK